MRPCVSALVELPRSNDVLYGLCCGVASGVCDALGKETLEDEGLARNDIRDAVRSFFPKRDCFTLVRPISDEDKLCDLSKVPYAELREEFRTGVRCCCTRGTWPECAVFSPGVIGALAHPARSHETASVFCA